MDGPGVWISSRHLFVTQLRHRARRNRWWNLFFRLGSRTLWPRRSNSPPIRWVVRRPPTRTCTWGLGTPTGVLFPIQSDTTETITPQHDAQRPHGGQRDSSTTVARTRAHSYYMICLRLYHGWASRHTANNRDAMTLYATPRHSYAQCAT